MRKSAILILICFIGITIVLYGCASPPSAPNYTPLRDITAIDCGNDHSLALKNDGTVWAWGDNFFGNLGDGSSTNRNIPVQVVK